jgi:RNA polymerase sigma-70 factor (ECF subfamily)
VSTVDVTDQQLWAEASDGSGAAFGELFDRHARAVYNHCFRLSGSWFNAEDHLQATFLLAWRKRRQAKLLNASARPWLLAVATNVVRSEQRSIRRQLNLLTALHNSTPASDEAIADHADGVVARLDAERRVAEILPAIRSLPRAEREAVALCLWSGVSYADAAEVLGVAEGSVRARVSRARARLNRGLAEHPTCAAVAEVVR